MPNTKELPTGEQKERFWKWCGWVWWEQGQCWCIGKSGISRELPELDLNNLFKYAVLKLQLPDISFYYSQEKLWYVKIYGEPFGKAGKTPELALFKALYQVMEADNGK